MATKEKKTELTVKFEYLELLSYMGSTLVMSFGAFGYYYFESVIPYFFVNHVIISLADLYSPHYLRNHNPEEQRAREKDWRFLIPLYSFTLAFVIEEYFLYHYIYNVF